MDRPLKGLDPLAASVRPTSIKLLQSAAEPVDGPTLQFFQAGEIERLRAELDASQKRYDALESTLPVGVVRVAPSGFIEHANAHAETLLGGGRLINQRMGRFIDQRDAAQFDSTLEQVLTGGEPRSCEISLIGKNGAQVRCQVGLQRLDDSAEARIVISLLDLRRITDATEAADRANAHVEALLQSSILPMIVIGGDRRIRSGNERAGELLATPTAALQGEAIDQWIVEANREAFHDLVNRRGRGPLTAEMVAAGQARRVRVYLTGVEWKAEPCLVVTLEDVSERERQASRDERDGRLASLGLLVAGVGHEVNNPLAFVVPNVHEVAEALRVMDPGRAVGHLTAAESVEMLDEAAEGLERIANIVRDLKGFHSTDDQLEMLSVNEVVVDTLRLADSRLRQSAKVRRDLGTVPTLQANRGRLGQVVLNLLFNAAEAMVERSPSESQIAVRTWFEGGVIHLLVSDNGRGIDSKHLPNLFDPFFTTRKAGSGLGLAICANIVRDMGGWIEVNSTVGTGTEFLLCFPLAGDEHVPRRVLVVSEEPMLIRGADREVSRRYAVVQACGGFEAIRILQHEEKVDAVVSARKLREGSGADVYDWVCRHRPALLSRFAFLEDGPATSSSGPTLLKPLTGRALTRLLDSIVT